MVMEVLQNDDDVWLRLHLENSADVCVCFLYWCVCTRTRTRVHQSIINSSYCSARDSMYCKMFPLVKFKVLVLWNLH